MAELSDNKSRARVELLRRFGKLATACLAMSEAEYLEATKEIRNAYRQELLENFAEKEKEASHD